MSDMPQETPPTGDPEHTGPAPTAPQEDQASATSRSETADDTEAAAADLECDLEHLTDELKKANERVLRTQAELENYRKRVRRDAEEDRKYANGPLMRDLLTVVDNIDRAIVAAETADAAGDNSGLLEGFKMVAAQIGDVLKKHQCKRIEALGVPFDPNLHEAILQQPSDEHPPGTVLQVSLEGYTLYDRVIRASQVIVSAAPPDAP